MNVVLILFVALAGVAALCVALAHRWAETPHGHLRPIFAFAFRMQGIFMPKTREGVLAVDPMETPEQRARVRRHFLAQTAPMAKRHAFAGTIEDRELERPGGALRVRIYTPQGAGPFPLLVYFHGGGFIVGSPEYVDPSMRVIAERAPAVVVSVDYRLAPEAPWPAAVEDCEFAVDWCLEHAAALKARPGKLAIGGDSAGGNLSAVLAQRARDAGRDHIGLQVLVYPAVDVTRSDRESQVAFASGYGLSAKDVVNCFAYYAAGEDPSQPGLSPLRHPNLGGLPRALVFTAGFDVLRDEGTEYAELLEKAGVPVAHVREPHVPHGYITMTRVCREAEDSLERIAAELRSVA